MTVSVGWWARPTPLYLGKGIRFGDRRRRSRRLTLRMDDRTRHVYCIGGSGGGKSRFCRHLLTQDVIANRSFGLIDAQDLVRETLSLIAQTALPGPLTAAAIEGLGDKLIAIEPALQTYGCPGFNPLAPRPGVQTFELVDNLIQLLTELWPDSIGPRLIDISRNALLCLAELGYTIAEMPLFLSDAAVRNMLVRRCHNEDVQTFFLRHLGGLRAGEQRVWYESSRNKWNSFAASPFIRPLIGQQRSTINFDDILENGKIILINLSRSHLAAESRSVLGGMFINSLHQAAIAREDTPLDQRYLFNLYIDEAQSYWTTTIQEILEAGRKYALALHLFHQSTVQAPFDTNRGAIDTTLANAHTRICFGVARQDAERMAREFFNPSGTAVKYQQRFLGLPNERPVFWGMAEETENVVAELMQQLPQEAYISFKGMRKDFLPYQVRIPFVPDLVEQAEKVAALRRHVAARYYRPIDQVNREISERWARLRAQANLRGQE